jgi:hypothetical protein
MLDTYLTLSQINELQKAVSSMPVKSLEVQNEVFKKLTPYIKQNLLEKSESAFSDILDKSFVIAFKENSFKDFIKEKNRFYEKFWSKEILKFWVLNFTSIKGIISLSVFSTIFILLYFVLIVKSIVLVFLVEIVFLAFFVISQTFYFIRKKKRVEKTYIHYFQSILYRNVLLALLMLNSLFILISSPLDGRIFTIIDSIVIALILTLEILLFFGQTKYFPDLLIKNLDLLKEVKDLSK